jgi:hypothetical protein
VVFFLIATTKVFLKPSHMRNIFRRGVKNEADIYEVLPSFKSQMLGDKLETNWNGQRFQDDPSVFKILWNHFRKQYLLLAITQVQ